MSPAAPTGPDDGAVDPGEDPVAPTAPESTRRSAPVAGGLRGLLASSTRVTIATFAVGLVLALRDIYIAAAYGRSAEVDAYILALLIPVTLSQVAGGAMRSSFIPAYVKLAHSPSRDRLRAFVESINTVTYAALAVLALVTFFAGPAGVGLVARSNESLGNPALRTLVYLLAPLVAVRGVAHLWVAFLEAEGRLLLAAVNRATVAIGSMLGIFFLAGRWGIYGLAAGTIVGMAAHAAIYAGALRRIGVSLAARWHGFTPEVRRVGPQYFAWLLSSGMTGTTLLIDNGMAATLGEGQVSALNYGYRIVVFAMALGSAGVGIAILPYATRLVVEHRFDEVRRTIRWFLAIIFVLGGTGTAILAGFAEPLVALVFERGAFAADDTVVVAGVQAMYAFGLPPMLALILCLRVLSSLERNDVLPWVALFSITGNVIFNLIFMRTMGAAGIALSTSVVYAGTSAVALYVARRVLAGREAAAEIEP